jgi:predicted ATPase/DNA-binding SARP family transcriptional activator/Tfp pilus assembly protein PilF
MLACFSVPVVYTQEHYPCRTFSVAFSVEQQKRSTPPFFLWTCAFLPEPGEEGATPLMTVPAAISSALTLALFGPMQVLVQGEPLPRLRSRQSLWLLALLTLRHPRPVEREWLAGTLWPDSEQSQAFRNLRVALSELRSALGAERRRLQSPNRHTLSLDLTGAEVDVRTFDAAILSGERSALEQAVALYRGPLLEGCLEEWIGPEREVREHQCLRALQQLVESALTGEDYDTAIGYCQRAARMDPLSDAAWRGWMEALSRSGDRNAALQVYRQFRDLLHKDDPTATPDEQTNALYRRLREEARQQSSALTGQAPIAARPTVTGYLPHPLTDLVGREAECIEVSACLRRSRLVTLTGVGGIGKTRLAREVTSEVVGEYKDGVWLVGLDSLTEGHLVVQQLASVLGLREEQGRTLLLGVTEHLRPKRLLLVLDNCEHLLEASAQVAAHLLRECAEVRILATSREALGITGETVWSVPALAVPDTEHLPQGQATLLRVLMGYESVQLFVERAQAVQKTFNLSASNARAVAQVCQQLEGIPLAIELAAARVRVLSVGQIAARLEDHLGLLTGGNRAGQSRQQTLRATLDWSYALLSGAERSLLRGLSVFAGGCILEAAEQVCGGAGEEAGQVLDLLTSLVDKSLVVFEEREAEEGRYRLLEMVRQYAAEGLQESGETEPIRIRHRNWFLALAEAAEPQLRGAEQADWLRRLDREHANLRAALAFSEMGAQRAQEGLRLASALFRFWQQRGDFSEGREALDRALTREGGQEATAERAKALNACGLLAYRQGDYASASALSEESLKLHRALGNKTGIANALTNLGNVAHDQGNLEAAQTLYMESLGLQRELADTVGIAASISNLGSVAYFQGDYETARRHFEESLAIRQEIGDRWGIALSLNNLGIVARQQSDYETARRHFEESLAIRRELGDKAGIASSLRDLGSVVYFQGDYETARRQFEESLLIRQEIGDQEGIAASLGNLGQVILDQGDAVAARAYLEEALFLNREIGKRVWEANNLGNLGRVACIQADYASAHSLYEQSLAIRQEMGDQEGIASLLEAFAGLVGRQGQCERAVRLLGTAGALCKTLGRTPPAGDATEYKRTVATARAALSEEVFVAAWEEGQARTLEQSVAYALEEHGARVGSL